MDLKSKQHTWMRLLLCLLLLLPAVLLFLLPSGGIAVGAHWLWMLLVVCFWLMLFAVGSPEESPAHVQSQPAKRMLYPEEQPPSVREAMDVEIATDEAGTLLFRGKLRRSAEDAFHKLKQTLPAGTTPLIQEGEDGGALIVLARSPDQDQGKPQVRPWVHWLLFLLTLLTTTAAGAAQQGVSLWREPGRFTLGLPYALGLMAILGVHELGHYFIARRHGIQVTRPYFIPVPFALGTFGAFIQMRSTPENRRMLFDVAVAGPLAGLAIAIPALLIGLHSSTIVPGDTAGLPMHGSGTSVGSSILFALLARVSLGEALTYGHVVQLSPLAFAGWLGLFITALNLLPIGQLDGGHIVQALFGRRAAATIGSVAMWSLLLLALFVWPGLMMWAILVFFIAGPSVPPLNDVTPLSPGRRWLGYAALVLLGLILIPLPHSLWQQVGIHCPYA